MKNTIVNILVFILMFNIIMIIFPEGKTQKYCKFIIKIFIMIYIINNIFFNGKIALDDFLKNIPENAHTYEREINLKNIDKKYIDLFNKDFYDGEEVIKGITLNFADDLNIKAIVSLNEYLNFMEIDNLKKEIAEIFEISSENIEIDL